MKVEGKIRSRGFYATMTLIVIVVGLLSRKYPLFPGFLGKYPGDALWSLMVFFGLGALLKGTSTLKLACLTLAISFLDEFSQMFHAPWIDALRATTIGHLILGSEFGWKDLIAYVAGVAIGVAIEVGSRGYLPHSRESLRPERARTEDRTAD